jgi:hypothetical protein
MYALISTRYLGDGWDVEAPRGRGSGCAICVNAATLHAAVWHRTIRTSMCFYRMFVCLGFTYTKVTYFDCLNCFHCSNVQV